MDQRQQLAMLDIPGPGGSFVECLHASGLFPLKATGMEILQLNITRRCNLSCRHCHVEASPDRSEMMPEDIIEKCIDVAAIPEITTIDITGGAPELHPNLPKLMRGLATTGKRIIVRTNLAVLTEEAYRSFPDMFREIGVQIVGSLPDCTAERTDRQRGPGTFARCIDAIRHLNEIGYGREGTGLMLYLMHNPTGAFLPGNHSSLEHEYTRRLGKGFGVEFNGLFVLTNCPVGRYLEFLANSDNLNDYMGALSLAFNPSTLPFVMCRNTLSVGWDGQMYDCDFNQKLGLTVNNGLPAHIRDFDLKRLLPREIVVRNHCFACCAGAGSSCQGTQLK